MTKRFFNRYFELLFWVAALIALAVTDPKTATHFSLCPFKALGITWCPGCGIGHAISFLFRGKLKSSFQAHWLGVPALIIVVYRIFTLTRNTFFSPPKSFTLPTSVPH